MDSQPPIVVPVNPPFCAGDRLQAKIVWGANTIWNTRKNQNSRYLLESVHWLCEHSCDLSLIPWYWLDTERCPGNKHFVCLVFLAKPCYGFLVMESDRRAYSLCSQVRLYKNMLSIHSLQSCIIRETRSIQWVLLNTHWVCSLTVVLLNVHSSFAICKFPGLYTILTNANILRMQAWSIPQGSNFHNFPTRQQSQVTTIADGDWCFLWINYDYQKLAS